jgi:cephalosporin hydroxylase
MLDFYTVKIAKVGTLVRTRGPGPAVRAVLRYGIGILSKVRMACLNVLLRSDVLLFRYKWLVRRFNRLVYLLRLHTFDDTRFLGKHILKFPTDLWVYQELIYELRPDVIVESGVFLGGSTYYFARLCEMVGNGRIIGIDTTLAHVDPDTVALANVTLIEGSSIDEAVFDRVRSQIRDHESVMVILDSDHDADHVLKEMRLYSQLVTAGQYLIVEDGIVDQVYPVLFNRGPGQAISKFLATDRSFAVDHMRNKYLLTVSPGGYLRKLGTPPAAAKNDLYRPMLLWLPGSSIPAQPSWHRLLGQGQNPPKSAQR